MRFFFRVGFPPDILDTKQPELFSNWGTGFGGFGIFNIIPGSFFMAGVGWVGKGIWEGAKVLSFSVCWVGSMKRAMGKGVKERR